MQLSGEFESEVRNLVAKYTMETKPHELAIIQSVLGMKCDPDEWRFVSGVSCTCGRKISNLDYFFSAVGFHGRDFIVKMSSLERDDKIYFEITDHHISIKCLDCGAVDEEIAEPLACNKPNCSSYFYPHTGGGIYNVRLSQVWMDRIQDELTAILSKSGPQ